MEQFFCEMPYQSFPTFSLPHLAALAGIGIVCLSFFVFRSRLRAREDGKIAGGMLGRIFLTFMVFQQLALYLWYASIGRFDASTCLPFQLCGASVWLCVTLWITQDHRIFEVVYFWGLCGTAQALLIPSMDGYVFPHFRFFQFFAGHGMIVVTIFYFLAVRGWRVDLSSLKKSFVWLQLLAVCAGAANLLTGGNYMFLARKPDSASLLSFLPDWPYYLVLLEVLALAFMGLALLPFMLPDKLARWREFLQKAKGDTHYEAAADSL